ncbi:hypothetical protein DR999_PMT07410 [Platysternon megacephalum]|uniref:Uncharacterized protein n=1 Tax=Platysternon megacephalum TaxID=55544 RepID=A0A4D9ENA2_9SAUR|nr:hypothetical protein DR999_PMT07410 [Platysternon megacephalum]
MNYVHHIKTGKRLCVHINECRCQKNVLNRNETLSLSTPIAIRHFTNHLLPSFVSSRQSQFGNFSTSHPLHASLFQEGLKNPAWSRLSRKPYFFLITLVNFG